MHLLIWRKVTPFIWICSKYVFGITISIFVFFFLVVMILYFIVQCFIYCGLHTFPLLAILFYPYTSVMTHCLFTLAVWQDSLVVTGSYLISGALKFFVYSFIWTWDMAFDSNNICGFDVTALIWICTSLRKRTSDVTEFHRLGDLDAVSV